jgi:fatty-acyl-CoA synthase
METPLTPLEFARRARKVYPEQIAVIDGESRWNYAQFLDRCDRWSAVLQQLGVGAGDRVAYLAPNTHAQLESFYSVPQIGAVLVPLNYRLTAEDFVYLINHNGSRMICADREYLGTVAGVAGYLSADASLRRLSRICARVQAANPKTNAGFGYAWMQ